MTARAACSCRAPVRHAASALAGAACRARGSSASSRRWRRDPGRSSRGPWLGEVGFELLYWVPFLRWFAGRFECRPRASRWSSLAAERRRGTGRCRSSYCRRLRRRHAGRCFARQHDERVADDRRAEADACGRRSTTPLVDHRSTGACEHRRLVAVASVEDVRRCSTRSGGDTCRSTWVHEHARYAARCPSVPREASMITPAPYVAVKFYFNDCFPGHRRESGVRARRAPRPRGARSGGRARPPVSTSTITAACAWMTLGVRHLPPKTRAGDEPRVQSAVVARARAFVGTLWRVSRTSRRSTACGRWRCSANRMDFRASTCTWRSRRSADRSLESAVRATMLRRATSICGSGVGGDGVSGWSWAAFDGRARTAKRVAFAETKRGWKIARERARGAGVAALNLAGEAAPTPAAGARRGAEAGLRAGRVEEAPGHLSRRVDGRARAGARRVRLDARSSSVRGCPKSATRCSTGFRFVRWVQMRRTGSRPRGWSWSRVAARPRGIGDITTQAVELFDLMSPEEYRGAPTRGVAPPTGGTLKQFGRVRHGRRDRAPRGAAHRLQPRAVAAPVADVPAVSAVLARPSSDVVSRAADPLPPDASARGRRCRPCPRSTSPSSSIRRLRCHRPDAVRRALQSMVVGAGRAQAGRACSTPASPLDDHEDYAFDGAGRVRQPARAASGRRTISRCSPR